MKLIIIDDDIFVTSSLKTILEMDNELEVIGIGHSCNEASMLYRNLHPDIVLMDIQMGEDDGLTASEDILTYDPLARIILLTTFNDEEYIIRSLNIGTKGYLLKQDYEHLIPAIKAVYSGQAVYGRDIMKQLPTLIPSKDSFNYSKAGLTDREYKLTVLVAQGLNNKEISQQLFLSEGTVRNYLSTILEKLHLRDRTQLAIYYLNNI